MDLSKSIEQLDKKLKQKIDNKQLLDDISCNIPLLQELSKGSLEDEKTLDAMCKLC